MGSSGWSHLGVQGHMGGGQCRTLPPHSLLPNTRAFKQEWPWSHRPQGKLSPRDLWAGGARAALSAPGSLPLRGWWVPQAVARTSGGLSAGAAAHTWLPGHPRLPPSVAAPGPKGKAGPQEQG